MATIPQKMGPLVFMKSPKNTMLCPTILSRHKKWFKPRSISNSYRVIGRVRIVLSQRRTVVGNWGFENLSGSHRQVQATCRSGCRNHSYQQQFYSEHNSPRTIALYKLLLYHNKFLLFLANIYITNAAKVIQCHIKYFFQQTTALHRELLLMCFYVEF